jgi:hypothetical protein
VIEENEEINQHDLSEEIQRLRPEIVFERRNSNQRGGRTRDGEKEVSEGSDRHEVKTMETIEFSCLYEYISPGKDTQEPVEEEKKRKHADLAMELMRLREQVRMKAVIVSHLGAVYGPSLKDLQNAKARKKDVGNSYHWIDRDLATESA